MKTKMKNTVGIVAIIAIAAFAGNMINIGMSYAVHWQSLAPMEFMKAFSIDFPLLLGPTAVTLLPALLGSLFMIFSSKSDSRKFWSFAFIGVILTVVITATYHLPTNLEFMELKLSDNEVNQKLGLWIKLHWLRVAIALFAAVFAILGLKESVESNNSYQ